MQLAPGWPAEDLLPASAVLRARCSRARARKLRGWISRASNGRSAQRRPVPNLQASGLLPGSQGGWGTLDLHTAWIPAYHLGLLCSVLAMAASFPQEVLVAEKICGPGSSN